MFIIAVQHDVGNDVIFEELPKNVLTKRREQEEAKLERKTFKGAIGGSEERCSCSAENASVLAMKVKIVRQSSALQSSGEIGEEVRCNKELLEDGWRRQQRMVNRMNDTIRSFVVFRDDLAEEVDVEVVEPMARPDSHRLAVQ